MITDNLVVNGLIKVTSQAEVNTLTVDQVNDTSGEDIAQLQGATSNVQEQINALATSYDESIDNSTEFKSGVANAVNSLSDEPNLNSESTLEQYVTAISLLGGKNYKGRLTASDDLDNVSDDGFYDIVSTDQPVHIPSDCGGMSACVEVFNLPEIETIYQRYHRFQGGVFTYSRRKFNGAWSNWVAYTFGVKGNAEASYRSGNVNITPENIGAISTSGGTVTGTISSSLSTHSYLAGNKGTTIINSTAGAGVYVMLAKMNSTNGYFTHGVYNNEYVLYYTDKATVDADTNSYTKAVRLLDESGSSSFPGELNVAGCINVAYPQAIRVRHVDGSNNGELYLNYNNPTQKVHIGNAGYGFTNNGSIYNGYTYRNYLPRVAKSCAYQPGAFTGIWEEFTAGDSYSLPTNAWYHIFTGQGADANYNTQLALGMTTTNIAYRNRNGGTWGSWQTILTSGNYSSYLGSADYPTGFAYRTTSSEWGNTTGTHVTGWHIEGCEIAFMKNNPSSGKLSAKIDGYFYQNEGTYRVLDTSDLGGLMPNPWANNTLYTIGDDVAMGDGDIAGCLVLKGLNGATGIQFNPYSGSTPQKISIDGSGLMSITGNLNVGAITVSGRVANSGDDEGILVSPASNGWSALTLGTTNGRRSYFAMSSSDAPIWRYSSDGSTNWVITHPCKSGTIALTSDLDTLKSNFQAGVDSIYNAIVAQGTTPASKSLSDVTAGIAKLGSSRYNCISWSHTIGVGEMSSVFELLGGTKTLSSSSWISAASSSYYSSYTYTVSALAGKMSDSSFAVCRITCPDYDIRRGNGADSYRYLKELVLFADKYTGDSYSDNVNRGSNSGVSIWTHVLWGQWYDASAIKTSSTSSVFEIYFEIFSEGDLNYSPGTVHVFFMYNKANTIAFRGPLKFEFWVFYK